MSPNLSDLTLPPHFSGVVRLFPLPNLVLFPGVVQALHVFEPRYRKMAVDALESDGLFTMCLYRELEKAADSAAKPPAIHEHVCICKVFAHEQLDDGRYNLMIAGISRAVIRRELAVEQPYRMAEVDLVEDELTLNDEQLEKLKTDLLAKCNSAKLLSNLTNKMDFTKIVEQNLPLSLFVDLIAFAGELDCLQRQEILKIANVEIRCWKLMELLGSSPKKSSNDSSTFPPDFSSN